MPSPNPLSLKSGPITNTLQTQKSSKRISNQGLNNPALLKNKPELLRLNEPMGKDIGIPPKLLDKSQKKKMSKKTQNKWIIIIHLKYT